MITTRELLQDWAEDINARIAEGGTLPTFDKDEAYLLGWLLFEKPAGFQAWVIKDVDRLATRQFLAHREAQRQGMPINLGVRHLRRMRFLDALIRAKFNATAAARLYGYFWLICQAERLSDEAQPSRFAY